MAETKTYRTETGAKRAANKAYSPVVVELADGSYDWFPQGYPLPQGAAIVSRYVVNQWRSFWSGRETYGKGEGDAGNT